MNKFKNFIGYTDEDFYDEEYAPNGGQTTAYRDEEEPQVAPPTSFSSHSATNPYSVEQPAPKVTTDYDSSKIVNIHSNAQLQVVLVKPERFEDASGIADHLNAKRTIILNLESANKDVTRRLIDFLSGVAYANNGQIKRVANSTYIITPYNVDIMGDLLDELENSGMFF